MYGWTSWPPLAIVATAVIIWRGVTLIPWPKEFVARSTGYHSGSSLVRTPPAASPPSPTCVGSPKPNRLMYS